MKIVLSKVKGRQHLATDYHNLQWSLGNYILGNTATILFLSLLTPWNFFLPCWAGEGRSFTEAQALVERTVAKYPNLVRLTIHAVPTGEKNSRIIACNVKKKAKQIAGEVGQAIQEAGKPIW